VAKPSESEIGDVLNRCSEMADSGENPFFGMTYAQGVQAGIEFMQGEQDDPLSE
jgi:hypothetical protein